MQTSSALRSHRPRLDSDGIAEAIHELHARIAAEGHTRAQWNVGSDRLIAHGLEREDHLTALVWVDFLGAGTAALTVQARVTSRPILESIGFTPTSEVEVLLDPATC